VLGFLSVSTDLFNGETICVCKFQSRAGFSECLDLPVSSRLTVTTCFNPVLGFLSVSTWEEIMLCDKTHEFQSRAGFSECLDSGISLSRYTRWTVSIPCWVF